MALDTKAIGRALLERRRNCQFSQEDVAERSGASQSTVDRLEKGNFKRLPSDLPKIARVVDLDLAPFGIDIPAAEPIQSFTRPSDNNPVEKIPVYGTAEGGRGSLILSSGPVERREAPPPLIGVLESYGVLITNNSMIPALKPGDIAWVNPHIPARPDDEVVLQRDEHGTRYGMVKTLLKKTETEYRLRQWNPRRDFTRDKKAWPLCHVVVGKYSRR